MVVITALYLILPATTPHIETFVHMMSMLHFRLHLQNTIPHCLCMAKLKVCSSPCHPSCTCTDYKDAQAAEISPDALDDQTSVGMECKAWRHVGCVSVIYWHKKILLTSEWLDGAVLVEGATLTVFNPLF